MKNINRGTAVLLIALTVFMALPMGSREAHASTAISQVAHLRVHNSVALYIGNHRAIVNNKLTTIDPLSNLTKPLIQNARTLVPVRFIAENFGALVGWDDATRSVPITLGSTNILLKINSRDMVVNGVNKTLDVTPVIHNKRTFVPLRAITEAFGKHVFYDRELIVVSDKAVLDAKTDKQVVDELITWFKTAKVPVWQNPLLSMQQLSAMDKSAVAVFAYDQQGEAVGQGSGFSLGNGLFATSLHVLLGGKTFKIMDNDRKVIGVDGVVAYDLDWDLAILRTTEAKSIPALPLGRLSSVRKGDQVVAIGSPLGLINSVSTGLVSNIHVYEGVHLIQITAPLAPGSSGGVLLNMHGQAIGVTFMGIEATDLNFVIPIDYLLPLYDPIKNTAVGSIPLLDLPVIADPVPDPPTFKLSSIADYVVDVGPGDAIMHPDEPVIYMTNYGEVVAINYVTREVRRIATNTHPTRVVFANGELYASHSYDSDSHHYPKEGNKAQITVIDPHSFAVKTTINVDMTIFDLKVDNRGTIYVSGASSQSFELASFDRTGRRLSQVEGTGLFRLSLDPSYEVLYAVLTGHQLRAYAIAQGVIGNLLRTFDEYVYQASPSPDGRTIYLGSGKVLDRDFDPLGTVAKYNWASIAFDEEHSEVFIPASPWHINVHDTQTAEHLYTLETAALGEFLFYRNNELIVLGTNGRTRVTIYTLN